MDGVDLECRNSLFQHARSQNKAILDVYVPGQLSISRLITHLWGSIIGPTFVCKACV